MPRRTGARSLDRYATRRREDANRDEGVRVARLLWGGGPVNMGGIFVLFQPRSCRVRPKAVYRGTHQPCAGSKEEHTAELQPQLLISYPVLCLKDKKRKDYQY